MTEMIVLASTSPARRDMLRSAGIPFRCEAPGIDERALASCHPQWPPAVMAMELAEAKAIEVSRRCLDDMVIGADQVLALGARVFSKPISLEECRAQLTELRGKTHSLISSVVTARRGSVLWRHRQVASLTMRNFSNEYIDHYLAISGRDCLSTVGGYKVEGLGIQMFEHIDGDHFTVLGLPLLALLGHLRETGDLLS